MSTPAKKFNLLFKDMKQMKMLKDNEANENFKTYEANKNAQRQILKPMK